MKNLFAIGAAALLLVGCEDFNEAMQSERQPSTPPGVASMDDVEAVQDAASGHQPGNNGAATQDVSTSRQTPQGGADGQQTQSEGRQAQGDGQQRQGIIGKTTAEVVDAQKALQDPKVVVADSKISGSDPLTQAGSAYITMTSKVSTLGFQQALKQHKALHGKNPTYEEFMQMANENRVNFAKLPPYQMYGYDEQEGKIVVLEDKAEKIRRYKEAGIPISEEDKQYE